MVAGNTEKNGRRKLLLTLPLKWQRESESRVTRPILFGKGDGSLFALLCKVNININHLIVTVMSAYRKFKDI